MTAIAERPVTAAGAHVVIDPAILYLGTPVVLVGTVNPDGTPNLAPISSVFWLGHTATIGMSPASQSRRNLARTGEATLNLPSVDLVDAVDRLALTTGRSDVPAHKLERGYRYQPDKFGVAGLTPVASELIAPPRVAECPVTMECTVSAAAEADANGMVVQLEVGRVHAHPDVLVPGRDNRIDPDRWRPLIMSFQHFYGLGERAHPSRLASIDEELYRD